MKVRNSVMIIAVVPLALAAFCWLWFVRDGREAPDATEEKPLRSRLIAGKETRRGKNVGKAPEMRLAKAAVSKGKRAHVMPEEFDDPEHPYSAEDKKVARHLQNMLDAVDDEDVEEQAVGNRSSFAKSARKSGLSPAKKRLLDAVSAAMRSKNPSVRKSAVEAASYLGKDALVEMTPAMADADQEVAELAIDKIETALMEIDSPLEQFELSLTYLNTFSANEEAMTMLAGTLEGAALQLIEPADCDNPADVSRAAQNRADIVDAMTTLIDKGGKLANQVRESYETITGSEWAGAEEAKLWAQDPENYEPPETP